MEIEVIGRSVPSPKSRAVKRVGAYCRVSTDLETQQLSLESQMVGFRQKIEKTPGWKLAGIYADEGITGTLARKRPKFNQMVRDALDGKIENRPTKLIQSDYSCRGSHFDFGGSQNRAVGHTF